jgi:hypothetical protein
MTETKSTDRTARQTMADVDHVHRHDPGASVRFYSRGPAAMADGGRTDEPEAAQHENDEHDEEKTEHESDERPRMKDVSHTPPTGDREVNRVFERGEEGRDGGR